MKDFYYLSSPHLSGSFRVTALGLSEKEGVLPDHHNLIKSKYEGINFPVMFKQISGKKFTDILNTGWPGLYSISDNLKELLEENLFTGWSTYPILL